jgi:hypothetical protein
MRAEEEKKGKKRKVEMEGGEKTSKIKGSGQGRK